MNTTNEAWCFVILNFYFVCFCFCFCFVCLFVCFRAYYPFPSGKAVGTKLWCRVSPQHLPQIPQGLQNTLQTSLVVRFDSFKLVQFRLWPSLKERDRFSSHVLLFLSGLVRCLFRVLTLLFDYLSI